MKKRILVSIFVVAVVAVAGWNFSQSKSEAALSDIALANVEALAVESDIVFLPLCAQICGNCWCIYFDPYEEYPGQIIPWQ
jgi:Tfp pilus assembly protein PilO